MYTESTIKPPIQLKFMIEETLNGKCIVHMYENIQHYENENGDTIYTYDEYMIDNVDYHENLKDNIKRNKELWLNIAKEKENEVEYTEEQKIQQAITDAQLETLEIILGGDINESDV